MRGYRAPTPTTPAPTVPKEEVTPTPGAPTREFTVVGTEFSFSPSSISVSAGESENYFQKSGQSSSQSCNSRIGYWNSNDWGRGKLTPLNLQPPHQELTLSTAQFLATEQLAWRRVRG